MSGPGSTLYYCTTDPMSRWVSSFNTVLDAPYVDYNFWNLDTRVSALEAGETSGGFSGGGGPFAEIESFTIAGDFAYLINGTFTATLTNGNTIGPDAFPFPMWLSAGAWQANTPYLVGNTFYIDGAVYGVIYPYPGAATFDAGATDGHGHNYFSPPIFVNPSDVLPTGGTTGQYLGKASDADYDVAWYTPYLTECADVVIASPLSSGQVLTYGGSHWSNEEPLAASLTSGSTAIADGTTNQLLYDNAGVLAEAVVGSGLSLSTGTLSASPAPAPVAALSQSSGTFINAPDFADIPLAFYTVTPTGDITLQTGNIFEGPQLVFIITTSGSVSYNVNWDSGSFKTQGTLATGTASGKVFTVCFSCDGSYWNETSRTTAM